MRFHRNVKMLRGQLDAAPVATLFFLLLIFALLGTLLYTPGVSLELPLAHDLPGLDRPSVHVAVDPQGRLYHANQMVNETILVARLREAARSAPEPLVLVVHADRAVTHERLIQVSLLARDAGIQQALLATLPRPFSGTGPDKHESP